MLSLPHHSFGNKLSRFGPGGSSGRGRQPRSLATVGGRRNGAGSARLRGPTQRGRPARLRPPGRGCAPPRVGPSHPSLDGRVLSHRHPSAQSLGALGLKALGQRRHGPLTPCLQRPTNTGLGSFPQLLTATLCTCICNLTFIAALEAAKGDRKKCRGKTKVLGRPHPHTLVFHSLPPPPPNHTRRTSKSYFQDCPPSNSLTAPVSRRFRLRCALVRIDPFSRVCRG